MQDHFLNEIPLASHTKYLTITMINNDYFYISKNISLHSYIISLHHKNKTTLTIFQPSCKGYSTLESTQKY